ncbi:MAG: hypothetical protein OSJ73_16595 [Lachnospiraceae bacterium]|nr:hypothetical protein [Lachnospiraceae bacterium]
MKGQLSSFNEAEVLYNKDTREPKADKMLRLKSRRKRTRGKVSCVNRRLKKE